MQYLVSPSLLSADFSDLKKDIEMLNNSEADWFHLDIMDGVFVPNISFGFPIIKSIRKLTKKLLDVHLMIVKPENYFDEFKKAGADILSFHVEGSTHIHRNIYAIKELGMKAGVVLNPHTPLSVIENVIKDVDLVLLMSVNPGFGGQKFIENTYNKIATLKEIILKTNSSALIEVDGGVNTDNAAALVKAGADVLVAGSAVFKSPNPQETINILKNV
jgi:ribulose-phosphate 3-epimerase